MVNGITERKNKHSQYIQGKQGVCLFLAVFCLCSFASPAAGATHVDALGRTVDIPSSPQRIVSLAPSITETLFALGLDREIVGVTTDSRYPAAALTRPRVGGFSSLSLERIIALNPDCVIGTADGNRRETVLQLERAGFPVYVTNPKDLESLFAMITDLGTVTGTSEAGVRLEEALRRRLEAVADRNRERPRPRVFLQISADPLITVGGDTFHDRVIEMAGGINIFGGSPVRYPRVNMEMVIAGKPDVIIMASMSTGEADRSRKKRWARWRDIPAVAEGRIYSIDPDILYQPTPRLVEGIEKIADMLHPPARDE